MERPKDNGEECDATGDIFIVSDQHRAVEGVVADALDYLVKHDLMTQEQADMQFYEWFNFNVEN